MKNLILISFLITMALPALAETFKIDGVRVDFSTDKKKRITANDVCKQKTPCQAMKILHKLSKDSLPSADLYGGSNPGTLLCEQVKGKVVMGEDAKGNQNSFCKFSDGSIMDCGTLTYYGIMNDRKKK